MIEFRGWKSPFGPKERITKKPAHRRWASALADCLTWPQVALNRHESVVTALHYSSDWIALLQGRLVTKTADCGPTDHFGLRTNCGLRTYCELRTDSVR